MLREWVQVDHEPPKPRPPHRSHPPLAPPLHVESVSPGRPGLLMMSVLWRHVQLTSLLTENMLPEVYVGFLQCVEAIWVELGVVLWVEPSCLAGEHAVNKLEHVRICYNVVN